MTAKTKIYRVALAFLFVFAASFAAQAQEVENELQPRLGVELTYSPIKKLNLSFSPEIRFNDSFEPNKYFLEVGADYKIFNYTRLEGEYRFGLKGSESPESFQRYALGVKVKKSFGRFTPALRLRYTNDADDLTTDKRFLRYKASVKYDIPNCKLTPFVAAEAFQAVSDGAQLYKSRYAAGASYKLMKNHSINAAYKLDYYNLELKNRHIISIGYKLKF